MTGLAGQFAAEGPAGMLDAFERAATRVGLAVFVVHVDATPPTVVYASELLEAFVGRPTAELVGRPPWELVARDERERVRELIASRGPGAPPITVHFETERPDGSRREVEVGVARVSVTGAELAVCYFRDVTDERRAIQALRASEARFRSLVEHAPDGIVIVQRGRIALANPVAVQMFGFSDLALVQGRLLGDLLPPEDAARAAERIARISMGENLGPSEYGVLADPNRVMEVHAIPGEHEGSPAIIAFVRDVTERKRMQRELLRADRLAAVGAMTATVAHEVNNPLTYLQLSLQRLELEVASEPDPARAAVLRESIANALHGAQRVARIVRDLGAQARVDTSEAIRPVDVVAIVDRALQMVEHDLRHRARLVRRYPGEPAIVNAMAGRLEQVVINVLVNAIHALDGNDPAKDQITVAVEVGREVTITVTDTGKGTAEQERVFEPFFTTKPVGQGTGLGLSVCKQLVESMHGRIELTSTVGVGTAVVIALPLATSPIELPTELVEPAGGDRLRVLLVDDEALVRVTTKMLLTSQHDVDDAAAAEAAVAMTADTAYDVILCDLMMPGMNGRDLYERIRELRPGLERRIVFVTGGAFVPALAQFLESVDNLKLSKPFTIAQVLAIIREAHCRVGAADA